MQKTAKYLESPRDPMLWGEGDMGSPTVRGEDVYLKPNGRVSLQWLTACEEERALTVNLMERIAELSNLTIALRQVVNNKGSAGIDGETVIELKEWFRHNWQKLQLSLLEGSYTPKGVRGVRIPKPKGGYRQLGIPTVKDRLVQQAISQVLSKRYEPIFSEHSYGFRPGRNAHQALLSNIVLDELDKELEARGHHFVRYADDQIILVKSEEAAKRVEKSITGYIENRMKLKVNREKSRICEPWELNFLGHNIHKEGGLGISRERLSRFKTKLRLITRRNRGISLEQLIQSLNPVLRGWLNYFRHARMKKALARLEAWLRRRIRCYRLKLCKRASGIIRFLRSRNLPDSRIWPLIGCGRGWYRIANLHASNEAMNLAWFIEIGLYNLFSNYSLIFKETAPYVARTRGGVRGR